MTCGRSESNSTSKYTTRDSILRSQRKDSLKRIDASSRQPATMRITAPIRDRKGLIRACWSYRLCRAPVFIVCAASNLFAASRFPTARSAAIFASCSLRGVVVPDSQA